MKNRKKVSLTGLFIALGIITTWAGSLFVLLTWDLGGVHWAWTIPAIIWQTYLYTGLFITAHDAMHGVVSPGRKGINNFIGTLAVILYALFSYRKLRTQHWKHHRNPASEEDPDFHDGEHPQFWAWYGHFLVGYVSWGQIVGMAIAYNIMEQLLLVDSLNLALFWAGPAVLSTFQLFYFGTYLPHRESEAGYRDRHNARSLPYSKFISLITCYHFGGYHWEHHAFPYVPWWKLPQKRRELLAEGKSLA